MEASAPREPQELPGPTRVGMRELRHDFRAWVDRVRAGEHVVVTDRGKPVMDMRPHQPELTWLQRMYADGLVVPARHPPRAVWKPGDAVTTTLSDELRRMRDEDDR